MDALLRAEPRHHDRDRPLARRLDGPAGSAAFTFFSPSRFSTYRCRLTHDGVPAPGTPATGSSAAFGGLADGHYIFEVAGTDEPGNADAHAARAGVSRSPRADPPSRSARIRPPRRRAVTSSFSFSSPSRTPRSSAGISLVGARLRIGERATPPRAPATAGSRTADGASRSGRATRRPRRGPGLPAEWLVHVDTTGPAFAAAERPTNPTSSRDADVRFVATEEIGGPITCRLDGGRSRDCSNGTFSVSGLRKGEHTLRITSSDVLGNVGQSNAVHVDDRLRSAAGCASRGRPSGSRPTADASVPLVVEEPIPRCSSAVRRVAGDAVRRRHVVRTVRRGAPRAQVWGLDAA